MVMTRNKEKVLLVPIFGVESKKKDYFPMKASLITSLSACLAEQKHFIVVGQFLGPVI